MVHFLFTEDHIPVRKKNLKDVACIKFTRCTPMMFCHITMKTNKFIYAF